jgi:xanthine dehydrogenase accessory factor
MNSLAILERVRTLQHQSARFALVTVVRAVAPTSASVGAQAIVLEEGTVEGWVGGGCTLEVIRDAARRVIASGEPRLVRITNDVPPGEDDTEQHVMNCASNGTVELFIQPYGSGRTLCVLGETPAADEARFLAARLSIPLADSVQNAAVVLVATQGEADEATLERALRSNAEHVLMIASQRKAQRLRDAMRALGIDPLRVSALESPAGPHVGARGPAEIALVAVTAALARLRGRQRTEQPAGLAPTLPVDHAWSSAGHFLNPVCGKLINMSSAKHVVEHGGSAFYFCCDGCHRSFLNDPDKYANPTLRRMM